MERPSPLPNLGLIDQTVGWILALGGIAEYFSERHYETVLRHINALLLGCDLARPALPDNWEEWCNTFHVDGHGGSTGVK